MKQAIRKTGLRFGFAILFIAVILSGGGCTTTQVSRVPAGQDDAQYPDYSNYTPSFPKAANGQVWKDKWDLPWSYEANEYGTESWENEETGDEFTRDEGQRAWQRSDWGMAPIPPLQTRSARPSGRRL